MYGLCWSVVICGSSYNTEADVHREVVCPFLRRGRQSERTRRVWYRRLLPSMSIIAPPSGFLFRCSILRFSSDKLPNFVALNSFCPDRANLPIMETSTGATHILKELENSMFCHPSHADDCIDAIALHECGDDLNSLCRVQTVIGVRPLRLSQLRTLS